MYVYSNSLRHGLQQSPSGDNLAGMTAHSERIQRMAPGNDITFEGHGALCVCLATLNVLWEARSLLWNVLFAWISSEYALESCIFGTYDHDSIKNGHNLACIPSRRTALLVLVLHHIDSCGDFDAEVALLLTKFGACQGSWWGNDDKKLRRRCVRVRLSLGLPGRSRTSSFFSFLGWLVCGCMHALGHHDGGTAQVQRRMENFGQVLSAAGRLVPLLGSLQYALVFRRELTFDLL